MTISVTIKFKLSMQEIWKLELNWDDNLTVYLILQYVCECEVFFFLPSDYLSSSRFPFYFLSRWQHHPVVKWFLEARLRPKYSQNTSLMAFEMGCIQKHHHPVKKVVQLKFPWWVTYTKGLISLFPTSHVLRCRQTMSGSKNEPLA